MKKLLALVALSLAYTPAWAEPNCATINPLPPEVAQMSSEGQVTYFQFQIGLAEWRAKTGAQAFLERLFDLETGDALSLDPDTERAAKRDAQLFAQILKRESEEAGFCARQALEKLTDNSK